MIYINLIPKNPVRNMSNIAPYTEIWIILIRNRNINNLNPETEIWIILIQRGRNMNNIIPDIEIWLILIEIQKYEL